MNTKKVFTKTIRSIVISTFLTCNISAQATVVDKLNAEKPLKNGLIKTSVKAIEFYQKRISPYKGYQCAYGYVHPEDFSCSEYGKHAIEENGVLKGTKLIFTRFNQCHEAYIQYANSISNAGDCPSGCFYIGDRY